MEVVRSVLFVGAVGSKSEYLLEAWNIGNPNRLVDSAPIESLHGSLSSTGVIKLDKTVIVTLTVELYSIMSEVPCEVQMVGVAQSWLTVRKSWFRLTNGAGSAWNVTYILVGNDLDTDHVACGLKNLLEYILRHSGV